MSASNLTLTDFLGDVTLRLNEPNPGFWSVAELTNYVNIALLRVTMDTLIPKKDTVVSLNGGPLYTTSIYPLPEDALRTEFVYMPQISSNVTNIVRMAPTTWTGMDRMDGAREHWEKEVPATPLNFLTFSFNRFILFPPPNGVVNTCTVHYTPQPVPLIQGTDATILPLIAQKLLPLYASCLAQMKADPRKAMLHLKEYHARMEAVRALVRHYNKSRPSVITPSVEFDRAQSSPAFRGRRSLYGYY